MTQVKNMKAEKRRDYARQFKGDHVTVHYGTYHDYTATGVVLTVATPAGAGTADTLILQVDHPEPDYVYRFASAISLATVKSIEKTNGEAP